MAEILHGLEMAAYRQGSESGKSSAKWTIERLEEEVKKLRGEIDRVHRRHEILGDQVVEVNGYGYRWSGDSPLEVGDRVLLPPNYVSVLQHGPGAWPGVVTALGTLYTGTLSRIVGRAPKG